MERKRKDMDMATDHDTVSPIEHDETANLRLALMERWRESCGHVGGCSRFDAKVVPIAVETDRKCGLNTPRAIVCDGRRFEIARVGATLPCPSMFGKADATVTGVLVDVGGRCVARGLICDDGLWFSVKPDG